jgi:hypothetical protein
VQVPSVTFPRRMRHGELIPIWICTCLQSPDETSRLGKTGYQENASKRDQSLRRDKSPAPGPVTQARPVTHGETSHARRDQSRTERPVTHMRTSRAWREDTKTKTNHLDKTSHQEKRHQERLVTQTRLVTQMRLYQMRRKAR